MDSMVGGLRTRGAGNNLFKVTSSLYCMRKDAVACLDASGQAQNAGTGSGRHNTAHFGNGCRLIWIWDHLYVQSAIYKLNINSHVEGTGEAFALRKTPVIISRSRMHQTFTDKKSPQE